MRFEIGDTAIITKRLWRQDRMVELVPSETVTIIGVYNTESGNQIVDIQPSRNRPKMVDIVLISGDEDKWPLKKTASAGGGE